MVYVRPIGSGDEISCLRSYGRAKVALQTDFETPLGRARCSVIDLSLGGAQLQIDQPIDRGESLWLWLNKVKVFGTVQWARGNMIGVQFEEKLPKALVLSLRGDHVDPKALEEVEAMLVAQNWVIGTPATRPKNVRIAQVLGGPGQADVARAAQLGRNSRQADRAGIGIDQRALLIFLFAALIGTMAGIASFMLR